MSSCSFSFLMRAADVLTKSGHKALRNDRLPVSLRLAIAQENVVMVRETIDEAAAQLPKPWSKPAIARAHSVIHSRR